MTLVLPLCQGTMSVMGDFSIKLGRALLKGFELKGLVVEVLYRPATDIKASRPILEVCLAHGAEGTPCLS